MKKPYSEVELIVVPIRDDVITASDQWETPEEDKD